MKVDFFLPQTAQFDKIINLFCLVFLTLKIFVCCILLTTYIIGFHCFYIIYSTEVSEFFMSYFISLYSSNTLFTETNSS